jgi:hypothetical protein
MAEANGNTTQDTTIDDVQQQNYMMVYGTNEFYNGPTVRIGGYDYTTVGGALEGTSLQLVPIETNGTDELVQQDVNPIGSNLINNNANPVIRLFEAPSTPRYRRIDNDELIPVGSPLHEHADGTIMTEHSMGPNDNSVVVYIPENDIILDTEPPLTARMQAGGGGTTQDMSEQMEAPDTQTGGGGGMY